MKKNYKKPEVKKVVNLKRPRLLAGSSCNQDYVDICTGGDVCSSDTCPTEIL